MSEKAPTPEERRKKALERLKYLVNHDIDLGSEVHLKKTKTKKNVWVVKLVHLDTGLVDLVSKDHPENYSNGHEPEELELAK